MNFTKEEIYCIEKVADMQCSSLNDKLYKHIETFLIYNAQTKGTKNNEKILKTLIDHHFWLVESETIWKSIRKKCEKERQQ